MLVTWSVEPVTSSNGHVASSWYSVTSNACKLPLSAVPVSSDFEHNIYLGQLQGHPYVVRPMLLCDLYRVMIETGYDFGQGIIIPFVKDRSENLSDITNYRAITVSPIISKLFELIVLKVCNEYLIFDELQFGFNVIESIVPRPFYTLRTTKDYFNLNGSTVYLAALDISINCFSKLIEAGLPKWFIDILVCWYEMVEVEQSLTPHPTQYRSFRRRSSQPIT